MAAFTIGYQNGYSDSKKANAPGGQGYSSAYKAGLEAGLKHEENHMQFLQSMRRAREAYYAATSGGINSSAMAYLPKNPIDTGSL
eukprot:CAMPEP_0196724556 /NCGR_PEP_ID=MMETSP1091-20130531/6356_1 /TAXON_ID=302021 /ORGANISM="Rhodomonas sp., Strain CCMP768" /LENGTH=84 /DNA_ID=CAMNT_0042066687 /DNA_START=121 /DNA_END=375 /DNA_ORIENTATION=+